MTTKLSKEQLLEFAARGLHQARIAKEVGLSRERVRQLAERYGVVLPHKGVTWYVRCEGCGCRLYRRKQGCSYRRRLCQRCDAAAATRSYVCNACGRVFELTRNEQQQRFRPTRVGQEVFCSRECYRRWRRDRALP